MTSITVNGIEISEAAIASEMQHHPAPTPDEAMEAAARALAVRTLLLERARALDLEPAPQIDEDGKRETEDDALVRQVLEAEVQTPEPDEDACRRYYENNKSRFTSSDLYEAAHILFSADSADKDAYAKATAEAQACLETLKENPHAFAELAKARSDCPSAESSGNLGQITRGQVTPEDALRRAHHLSAPACSGPNAALRDGARAHRGLSWRSGLAARGIAIYRAAGGRCGH